MSLLRAAARAYMLHRIVGAGRRRQARGAWARGYGHPSRARRRRSGFGWYGPLPGYSRRTRRGSRVHVTGCCLPIPLALSVGSAVAARQALRRSS